MTVALELPLQASQYPAQVGDWKLERVHERPQRAVYVYAGPPIVEVCPECHENIERVNRCIAIEVTPDGEYLGIRAYHSLCLQQLKRQPRPNMAVKAGERDQFQQPACGLCGAPYEEHGEYGWGLGYGERSCPTLPVSDDNVYHHGAPPLHRGPVRFAWQVEGDRLQADCGCRREPGTEPPRSVEAA